MKINKINSTVYIQVLNTAVFSLSIVKVKYAVKKSLKQKIKLQCGALFLALLISTMSFSIKGSYFKQSFLTTPFPENKKKNSL